MAPKSIASHLAVAVIAVAVFSAVSTGLSGRDANNEIVVTIAQQDAIAGEFEHNWGRAPNDIEMQDLIDDLVRDEMVYRESLRQSIGRDNSVVLGRLRAHLEDRAREQADNNQPTEDQLQEYLNQHAADYRLGTKVSFRQIFFDTQGNEIGADASARFMLGELRGAEMPEDIAALGDASTFPAAVTSLSDSDVQTMLGAEFAAQLRMAKAGEWSGPLRSDFGLHLVFVDNRSEGMVAELDDVRQDVSTAYQEQLQEDAVCGMYREFAERYDVTIELQ